MYDKARIWLVMPTAGMWLPKPEISFMRASYYDVPAYEELRNAIPKIPFSADWTPIDNNTITINNNGKIAVDDSKVVTYATGGDIDLHGNLYVRQNANKYLLMRPTTNSTTISQADGALILQSNNANTAGVNATMQLYVPDSATAGIASFVNTEIRANNIPAAPAQDGNYVLKCSIVDGVATYSWEPQS